MTPVTQGVMKTDDIKHEVDKGIEKLATLRDEVRLHLHLASMDAKQEWEDKLAPRVHEVEQTAKSISDSSRTAVTELIDKVEHFLEKLRPEKTG